MKKNLLSIILILLQIFSLQTTFAQGLVEQFKTTNQNSSATQEQTSAIQEQKAKLLLVSEKPLGAKKCECAVTESSEKDATTGRYSLVSTNKDTCDSKVSIEKRLYVCEKASLADMIKGIVGYIIQIALLLAVLAVAALGIAWGVAGGDDPEYKRKLKEWLVGLIVGLILIYGFQYILGIFGWIYVASV